MRISLDMFLQVADTVSRVQENPYSKGYKAKAVL